MTKNQIKRASSVVQLELIRGYSVTVSTFDWRIALTLKRLHPSISIELLLPDFVMDLDRKIPKSSFFKRYKKHYSNHQSFYGSDCDWFFTFNPKKYFLNLKALKIATGAEKVTLKKCSYCNFKSNEKNNNIYDSYKKYSYLSYENKHPTWNHKFKSHIVSLADYYQMHSQKMSMEAKKFLLCTKDMAANAEQKSSNDHRKGIKFFHDQLMDFIEKPDINHFKSLWHHAVFMNKISDIYASTADLKNYISSKKIELNMLLGIYSDKPLLLSDQQLTSAMFSHVQKQLKNFQLRNKVDEKYQQLVFEKSVAIVGAAPSKEENGQTIDNYDQVIRLRFPADTAEQSQYTGERTSIINNSLAFSSLMGDMLPSDPNIFYTYQSAIPLNNKASQCRTLFEWQNNLLTMPHAVPRILIDLMAFSPKKIKVFATTMFLSENGETHNSSYIEKISYFSDKKSLIEKKQSLLLSFFIMTLWSIFY